MGFFDTLLGMVNSGSGGGRDGMDRPNLRRQVVGEILRLKQRGKRGVELLPPAVTITITVGSGSVEVVRRFVGDTSFDKEIEAELLNRLVGAQSEALPLRTYVVQEGDGKPVTVTESAGGVFGWLEICDGDRAGEVVALSTSRAEHRVGRGAWHGDGGVPNDVIASEDARFVSRRAAVIERGSLGLAIRALDQGDCLLVVRADGRRVRPSNTRARRVKLEFGDQIELTDGGTQKITLRLCAQAPAEEDAQ